MMLRQLLSRPFTPANVNNYPYTYGRSSSYGQSSSSGSSSSVESSPTDFRTDYHHHHQTSPPSPAHSSAATAHHQYNLRHHPSSSSSSSWSSTPSPSSHGSSSPPPPRAYHTNTSSGATSTLRNLTDLDEPSMLDTSSAPLDLSPSRAQYEPDPALTAEDVLIQHEKSRQLRQQTMFDDGRSRS